MTAGSGELVGYGPEFSHEDPEVIAASPFVLGFERITTGRIALGVAGELDPSVVSEMGPDFNEDMQF